MALEVRSVSGACEMRAVFDDEGALRDVIGDLQINSFDRADISVPSRWRKVERHCGRLIGSIREIEDEPEIPRTHPADPSSLRTAMGAVIALPLYIGASIAIVTGAANGADPGSLGLMAAVGGAAGVLVGAPFAIMVKRRHLARIREQIARGGLLLWVRVRNHERAAAAAAILARHAARHVHVNEGRLAPAAPAGAGERPSHDSPVLRPASFSSA